MIMIPPPAMAAARGRPDHPAVVMGSESLTWRELAHRASCWATRLVERAVKPGDVVTLENAVNLDWIARFHAIGLAGAIAAPRLEGTWAHGSQPADAPLAERDWPIDEPRLSLLTSGSGGQQKTVELTTAQLVFSAMGSAARLGHHTDDRWLACLPFHHVGGLSILLRTAWLQTTAVITPRFDAIEVSKLIDEVTMVSLVPAMLARILDQRRTRFSEKLRVILLGGDKAPDELVLRARNMGAPIVLTWGMTEAASQVATGETKLMPMPFARVSISRDALVVEGPIAPNGRLVTSDRGKIGPDCAVTIDGRRDLVFVSGGENVDPVRIEQVLVTHPAIAEALVVGLPDPVLGKRAGMVLVAKNAENLPDLAAIRAFLAIQLAPAERPSRLIWSSEIPRGPAGKPSRERARALLSKEES